MLQANKWAPIDEFVNSINRNFQHVFSHCSMRLVVDEIMSLWYGRGGKDGEFDEKGLPHKTSIPRCDVFSHWFLSF